MNMRAEKAKQQTVYRFYFHVYECECSIDDFTCVCLY